MLIQILGSSVVLLLAVNFASAQQFPGPFDEPYMIQAWGRNLVWEPQDGELNSGNPIVLRPLDPTRLTQFWITRDIGRGRRCRRIVNAAAPDYIFSDWAGDEGFNATLKLNKEAADTQLWFTYSGSDNDYFQINAMSGLHYCVRGFGVDYPLNLAYCNDQDAYPFQRWVLNKNYTLPAAH